MDPLVVCDFGINEVFCPFVRSTFAEYSEVDFQFLIHALGLSVGLRVVGGGWGECDAQEFP